MIVAKIMLTLMLGIGPFFIAMLMFPATAKWFDSWFGQVMTYIMQIALVTTVLGMGMKFFRALTAKVLAVTTDHPIASMLEILIVTGVTLFLLQRAYEAASHLAGGVSSAGITLRQVSQAVASSVTQVLNHQITRRDMQSGMMVTGGRLQAAQSTVSDALGSVHIGLAIGGAISFITAHISALRLGNLFGCIPRPFLPDWLRRQAQRLCLVPTPCRQAAWPPDASRVKAAPGILTRFLRFASGCGLRSRP